MLRPIYRPDCAPALAACQRLMREFARWLCDVNVHSADITEANCRARMPTPVEGEWLWALLIKEMDRRTLLDRARVVADLSGGDKQRLEAWVHAVASVQAHFGPTPPANLPVDLPISGETRKAFNSLMVSFYEKGLKEMGVPYRVDGTPTGDANERIQYRAFVDQFREKHRTSPDRDAREVCVLCGGELAQAAVDHWVRKSAYSLLAVCADNLLPICSVCNVAPHKGQKDVHTNGAFADWFHPYWRHPNGVIELRYELASQTIKVSSAQPEDAKRVQNLDALLDLSRRWTKEFKAERRKMERGLQQRITKRGPLSELAVKLELEKYRDQVLDSEPNCHVHRLVAESMLDPACVRTFV